MTEISGGLHRQSVADKSIEQQFRELAMQDTIEWVPEMLSLWSLDVQNTQNTSSSVPSKTSDVRAVGIDNTYVHDALENKVYVRTPTEGTTERSLCYRAVKTIRGNVRVDKVTPGVLTRIMEDKIIRIVGAFESKNHHGAINRNPAGRGIAYGSLQVLSRTGGLEQLLEDYAKAGGRYARILRSFGDTKEESVVQRRDLQRWLIKAGQDPIMQRVQHEYFRKHYLAPALQFGQSLGLKQAASYLSVFDTFIHYGTDKGWIHRKIGFFVKKFGESKGMQRWTSWMRRSLQASYGKRFGAQSVITQYNVWRANQLRFWLRNNPELKGGIGIQAPNWRERLWVR